MPNKIKIFTLCVGAMLLSACGGGGGGDDDDPVAPATYSIGGTVSGLSSGASVTLQNNGGNALTVSAAGPFSFSTELASGAGYNVTISTQPSGQTCTASNSSGTVSNADISTIAISCSTAIDPNGVTVLSPTHKPTLVGIVIDSPVINLHYDAPVLDGTTNPQGQFDYLPGDLIKFKVGDVELPPVVGRPVITILDFAATTDINDTVVVNIARFLQSLDSDGDPSNGIMLSAQAHAAAMGHTLDFRSSGFDAAANPIIAAAGGANTSLIAANVAIANLQAGLAALPKLAPIAGAYITGSGTTTRALVFLENGLYYGMEGNCSGAPNYEYGTYTYDGAQLTLTVTENADNTCGLNSGAHAATLAGSTLTLAGQTWTEASSFPGLISGLYLADDVLGSPSYGTFSLTLFTDSQYVLLDALGECGVADATVEIGTYTIGAPTASGYPFTATAQADAESGCGLASTFTPGKFNIVDAPGVSGFPFIAFFDSASSSLILPLQIFPSREQQSLTGVWMFPVEAPNGSNMGSIIFTHDGRVFVDEGQNIDCPLPANSPSGEKGTYAWDSATNQLRTTITIDSDGDCGLNENDFAIQSAKIDGNLLTLTFTERGAQAIAVLPRNQFVRGFFDLWTRPASGSQSLLTLAANFQRNTVSDSDSTLVPYDSDCPSTPTSFPFEQMEVALTNPNGIAPATSPLLPPIDIANCGLPASVGPTYLLNGDTLTIDGLGTFTREN